MSDNERKLLVMTAEAMERLLRADAEALDEAPTAADAMRALIAKVQSRGLPSALVRLSTR